MAAPPTIPDAFSSNFAVQTLQFFFFFKYSNLKMFEQIANGYGDIEGPASLETSSRKARAICKLYRN